MTTGGLRVNSGTTEIVNTIFEGNNNYAVYESNPSADAVVTNCLFYNNQDGDYWDEGLTGYSGANAINLYVDQASDNFGGDPLFVDKASGDFHLQDGSAALDRGDVSAAPAQDFEGEVRPGVDGLVDIGVDEADNGFNPPLDTDPPVSKVVGLPEVVNTAIFNVPFIASDAETGIDFVKLYYRKNGGSWIQYGVTTFTSSPISFDSSGDGDGFYEFYSRATDNAGIEETDKTDPDDDTFVITNFIGAVIYVKHDATGTQTGESWTNAFHKITPALMVAQLFSVAEVWVVGNIPKIHSDG